MLPKLLPPFYGQYIIIVLAIISATFIGVNTVEENVYLIWRLGSLELCQESSGDQFSWG
jgi:hypothetical protein